MMKNSRITLLVYIFIFTLLMPMGVFAAPTPPMCPNPTLMSPVTPTNFTEVICLILDFISNLVPVIIGLTVITFLWGLAKFILAAGDEKKIQDGKNLMVWGIIGIFVMVSVWGIVRIVYGSFFSGPIGLPFLP